MGWYNSGDFEDIPVHQIGHILAGFYNAQREIANCLDISGVPSARSASYYDGLEIGGADFREEVELATDPRNCEDFTGIDIFSPGGLWTAQTAMECTEDLTWSDILDAMGFGPAFSFNYDDLPVKSLEYYFRISKQMLSLFRYYKATPNGILKHVDYTHYSKDGPCLAYRDGGTYNYADLAAALDAAWEGAKSTSSTNGGWTNARVATIQLHALYDGGEFSGMQFPGDAELNDYFVQTFIDDDAVIEVDLSAISGTTLRTKIHVEETRFTSGGYATTGDPQDYVYDGTTYTATGSTSNDFTYLAWPSCGTSRTKEMSFDEIPTDRPFDDGQACSSGTMGEVTDIHVDIDSAKTY